MQDIKDNPPIVEDAYGIGVSDLIELPVEALDEVSGGAGNAAIDF